MHVAPGFLITWEQGCRQRLEVRTFLFKARAHLFARGAMDALVGDADFPLCQEEIFLRQGLEPPAFERIAAHVGNSPLHLPLVLRRPRSARHDSHAVMAAEVGQLRVDLRIEPVRLQDRCFQVVEIEQKRHAPKVADRIFKAAQERFRVLPHDRFAVALARATQDHAENPTPTCLAFPVLNHRSQPEVHLHLLTGLTFHPPDPRRLRRPHLAHESLDRLVGVREPALLHQILINPLRAQPHFHLRQDRLRQWFALALATGYFAGGRNGWVCFSRSSTPGGRNGRV